MNRPPRPFTRRLFGAGAAALFWLFTASAAPVAAHDFWLEPSTYEPETPATVQVAVRVGEDFEGRPVRRSAEHIERFLIAGPAGQREIPGLEGRDPAGLAGIAIPGAHLIGYESSGSTITLAADRFERYLAHEGLEHVIAARRQLGEEQADGREMFVRSAKSLVFAAGDHDGFDRRLDLPLEFIPLADPTTLDKGEPLELLLLLDGQPAPGLLVRLRSRQRSTDPLSARTDESGRVRLPLSGSGPWLAAAVHMERIEELAGTDWRSLWASLTFPGPPTAEGASAPAVGRELEAAEQRHR